jgi:hypothetical protein
VTNVQCKPPENILFNLKNSQSPRAKRGNPTGYTHRSPFPPLPSRRAERPPPAVQIQAGKSFQFRLAGDPSRRTWGSSLLSLVRDFLSSLFYFSCVPGLWSVPFRLLVGQSLRFLEPSPDLNLPSFPSICRGFVP